MQLYVGTSGYSYKEWKGTFYPEKLPQKDMLGFYAERFTTVEMNNTFYRMPSVEVMEAWTRQVPGTFQFALKAPQTITHRKRLKNTEDELAKFVEGAAVLKRRQGPLFFQLPPNFKKDLPRLESFLALLDGSASVTFEFRHASWFDEEVCTCLRARGCALCIADMDESPQTTVIKTANWGYLRLRREEYTDAQLSDWIEQIRSQRWKKAYVFFKHEDTASGPRLAARFLELAGG